VIGESVVIFVPDAGDFLVAIIATV
jgi:hypothetical protein